MDTSSTNEPTRARILTMGVQRNGTILVIELSEPVENSLTAGLQEMRRDDYEGISIPLKGWLREDSFGNSVLTLYPNLD